MDAFKETLNNQAGLKASYTNNVFPGVNNTTVFRIAGTDQDRIMGTYFADYDHLDVLKIELAEGRYFSKDFPSDSTACLINEAAVKELGWTTDILNQKLTNYNADKPFDMQVVGVVKDFAEANDRGTMLMINATRARTKIYFFIYLIKLLKM